MSKTPRLAEGSFPYKNPSFEIRRYFEYASSGVQVEQDGLQEMSFGEFLIERGLLDRVQLFRTLQMQDRNPGVRLGEAAAALGYAHIRDVERAFGEFTAVGTVMVA